MAVVISSFSPGLLQQPPSRSSHLQFRTYMCTVTISLKETYSTPCLCLNTLNNFLIPTHTLALLQINSHMCLLYVQASVPTVSLVQEGHPTTVQSRGRPCYLQDPSSILLRKSPVLPSFPQQTHCVFLHYCVVRICL